MYLNTGSTRRGLPSTDDDDVFTSDQKKGRDEGLENFFFLTVTKTTQNCTIGWRGRRSGKKPGVYHRLGRERTTQPNQEQRLQHSKQLVVAQGRLN